ncbi:unnamed protein product [Toxocara canis]|uniref:Uncharacterized protein n=1 Tax=Toxocara canis TaxID=6265 RepID=A0A183TYY9_TOXCA|nr:unnamed protein product [Toxocara canis]
MRLRPTRSFIVCRHANPNRLETVFDNQPITSAAPLPDIGATVAQHPQATGSQTSDNHHNSLSSKTLSAIIDLVGQHIPNS